MRSATEKECPGCKTRQKFYAGNVCHQCEIKLRDYPSLKATVDQASGGSAVRLHFGARLALPMGCYKLPGSERMAEALSELVRASFPTEEVSPGEVTDPWVQRGAGRMYSGDGFFEVRHRDTQLCDFISTVPREFQEALRKFLFATDAVLRESNAEGRVQGQNLLFQLNDGSLSLDDFNVRLTQTQNGNKR